MLFLGKEVAVRDAVVLLNMFDQQGEEPEGCRMHPCGVPRNRGFSLHRGVDTSFRVQDGRWRIIQGILMAFFLRLV